MRALAGPVIHFYWYWLPEYLKRERQFSMETIEMLAGLPFVCAGAGNISGGWLAGFLMRRDWTVDRARKACFLLGGVLCGASVTGLTGLCEGVFNMTLTLATGRVVDRLSYLPVFVAAGALPAMAVLCLFVLIRKVERIP